MSYKFDVNKVKKRLGINLNGKAQHILDHKLVDYLRDYEPVDTTMLQTSTRVSRPGLVEVATKYAHYQNEGVVYVDPKTGKGAFHDPVSGRFWSRPNIKKIPSDRKFSTYGNKRGPHFVERTLKDKTDNTHILDIDTWNGTSGSYPAKMSDGIITVTSYMGEDAAIEYDLYYDGDPVEGTVTIADGVPTFTPNAA